MNLRTVSAKTLFLFAVIQIKGATDVHAALEEALVEAGEALSFTFCKDRV